LIKDSSVDTFFAVTREIIYFRPVTLDSSRLHGAEWNRLVAPSKSEPPEPPQPVEAPVSQARPPSTSSVVDTVIKPKCGRGPASLAGSQAPVKSFVPTPKAEISASGDLRTTPPPRASQGQNEQARQDGAGKIHSASIAVKQHTHPDVGDGASSITPAATPLSFIDRSNISAARVYRDLQELRERSRAAEGRERVEINRSIRRIKDAPYRPGRLTTSYCDIDGNPIGFVQVTNKGRVPGGCIEVADTEKVASISFDFVQMRPPVISDGKVRREVIDENTVALRFTAIISENGFEDLERLAKKIIKSSPHRFGIRPPKGRGETAPKKDVKRIMQAQNTFDTEIDGMPVHISTLGKVELHTAVPSMRLVTSDELSVEKAIWRHRKFTALSRGPKRWPLRTSDELNSAVKDGFERLAQALKRILE
jgi:hypothetical protein